MKPAHVGCQLSWLQGPWGPAKVQCAGIVRTGDRYVPRPPMMRTLGFSASDAILDVEIELGTVMLFEMLCGCSGAVTDASSGVQVRTRVKG